MATPLLHHDVPWFHRRFESRGSGLTARLLLSIDRSGRPEDALEIAKLAIEMRQESKCVIITILPHARVLGAG
jgi:hypothetical protein